MRIERHTHHITQKHTGHEGIMRLSTIMTRRIHHTATLHDGEWTQCRNERPRKRHGNQHHAVHHHKLGQNVNAVHIPLGMCATWHSATRSQHEYPLPAQKRKCAQDADPHVKLRRELPLAGRPTTAEEGGGTDATQLAQAKENVGEPALATIPTTHAALRARGRLDG